MGYLVRGLNRVRERCTISTENDKGRGSRKRSPRNAVMKIDGRKATHSVFMDEEVVKRLGVIDRGKIHVEIYPAVAPLSQVDAASGCCRFHFCRRFCFCYRFQHKHHSSLLPTISGRHNPSLQFHQKAHISFLVTSPPKQRL